MIKEQQRIAIAEACGFHVPVWIGDEQDCECGKCGCKPATHPFWPDYLEDLNACAEMEKTLPIVHNEGHTYGEFVINLIMGCYPNTSREQAKAFGVTWWSKEKTFSATAPQRCEAFLRTIGKWEE